MIVAGVPYDPGPYPQGAQTPMQVVCHRTYGAWGGDYGVGKGSRKGIGFHFLVGKDEGQWVQFYDTQQRCNHAAGGNRDSIGIEVTGTDDDVMTDWQVRALARIVDALAVGDGIPATHLDWSTGRVGSYCGYRDHGQVAGSTHTDGWTRADWDRIVSATGQEVDDMFTDEDRAALQALAATVSRRQRWAFEWGGMLHTVHVTGQGDLIHSAWTGTEWTVEKVGGGCDPGIPPEVTAEYPSRIRVWCRSADRSAVVHTVYEAATGQWSSAAVTS